ncbi:MAG: gliding motility protein GldL [Bacteroidaceae bacterium]|nr:gliding motility protein GldL [Bacteroidaceae bacterium]
MENTEKKNLLTRIQDYLDTPKGRILLNYLYSWGAAIVILGALFKLTHIKGANLMLFIGMGTEVLVFFISGFERPYIPGDADADEDMEPVHKARRSPVADVQAAATEAVQPALKASALNIPDLSSVGTDMESISAQISKLAESMESMLKHAERMQQSSEELETLTRNLISINTFYEMHLKSASAQMENLDNASQQTGTMVRQIEELNSLYARMISAMKVNSQLGNS